MESHAIAGSKEPPVVASAIKHDKKTRKTYALHKTRFILRAIALVFEVIAFFLIVGIAARYDGDNAYALIFPGIAIIWNVAEFITICIILSGIHPGAHIALDFIIFGLLVGPGGVLVANYSYDNLYDYDCSGNGPCVQIQDGTNRTFQGTGLAASIFMLLAGIIHFVLFVLACICVHRWRMDKRDSRFAWMQAQYQPQPISVTGGTDSSSAFLITYADGRQVIVPPSAHQQQHPQTSGYYAPTGYVPKTPGETTQTPISHGISVVPLPTTNVFGAGIGNTAGPGAGGMAIGGHTSQQSPKMQCTSQTQDTGNFGSTNV